MRHGARKAAVAIISIASVAAFTLSGCSSNGGTGGTSGEPTDGTGSTNGQIADAQREEALNTPTELTFWTWVPDIQDQVDMFMEEYPAINVTVENVGQGLDHYSKVRTASEAGSGGPDVVQLEYQFISSLAVSGERRGLTPYGAADR
jgi:multiple sugar transport system substrate-binding protein